MRRTFSLLSLALSLALVAGLAWSVPIVIPRAGGDLCLVSADAGVFLTVRVADLAATDLGKDVLAKLPAATKADLAKLEQKLGLKLADIERVTIVVRSVDDIVSPQQALDGAKYLYIVVQSTADLVPAKVLAALDMEKAREATRNDRKYHQKDDQAVYFHDDRMVAVGLVGGVRLAIDQAVKPVKVGRIATLLPQIARQHVAIGSSVPKDIQRANVPPDYADLASIERLLLLANLKEKALGIDILGSFPTNEKATGAETSLNQLKGAVGLFVGDPSVPKSVKEALESLAVRRDGSDLVLGMKTTLSTEDIVAGLASFVRVGGASDRAANQNNLKQMAIGFHNLHDATGRMNWAIFSLAPVGQRRPLHSWRVALLPYLEQEALYKQIRLNELWDSEHNKQFHNKMPKLFEVPGRAAPAGQTFYQVFVGPGAMFEKDNVVGRRIADVTDGTSNTLLIAEAQAAVNWMEPKDIPFEKAAIGFAFDALSEKIPEGAVVAFADGSVRLLPRTIKPLDLQALITAAGGEIVTLP